MTSYRMTGTVILFLASRPLSYFYQD